MTAAAMYLRISSDPTGQHLGVDRQREDCLKLAAAKGWTPVEYLDNDVSATNGKVRPAYARMLTDIAEDRIDAVLAWDLDRLYRQPRELEDLIDLADGKRLSLATVTGDCDLSTDNGRLFARIKGAVGKSETERKAARQRRAAVQKAQRGRPQWRKAFGYLPYTGTREDDTGFRELDPVTAPLVEQAYRAVLAGASLNEIARVFNDAGAYGLNGRPWAASTVSLFLRSPRNAGLRSHNDEIVTDDDGQPVKGTWAPLVDESLWLAVQSVISAPERAPGQKAVRKHLLTGVLMCGNCTDGRLSGRWVTQKTGGTPGRPKAGEIKEPSGQMNHAITYACKSCHGCSIRAEYVEPMLCSLVSERLSRPDAWDLLKAPVHDVAEVERLRTERATLLAQIAEAEREYDEGIIDGRRLQGRTERANAKLAELERQHQDQERVRVLDGLPLGTPEVAEAVESLSPDRFRAVLDMLVTVAIAPVGKGGRVFKPERVLDGVVWKV